MGTEGSVSFQASATTMQSSTEGKAQATHHALLGLPSSFPAEVRDTPATPWPKSDAGAVTATGKGDSAVVEAAATDGGDGPSISGTDCPSTA